MAGNLLGQFVEEFVRALEDGTPPTGLSDEKALKMEFIEPAVMKLASKYRTIEIATAPWGNKVKCERHCNHRKCGGKHVFGGCPTCWSSSKDWASVRSFGTHNFDLAARDPVSRETMVGEVKLFKVSRGRKPNGEVQRSLGQCLLARAKHPLVLGIWGFRGRREKVLESDILQVIKRCNDIGIRVVRLQVP